MRGLAAVKQRIEEAFRTVHNDQRTREQVDASRELQAALQVPQATVDNNETSSAEAFERKAEVLARVALRCPHIAKQPARRTDVGPVWVIEEPKETAETLFEQALRYLEGDRG